MSATTNNNESTTGDVVDLLLAQHQEVKRLFSEVHGPGEDRAEAFARLVRLLAVHETAEEEVVYPAVRSTGPEGERAAEARKAEEADAKRELADLEKLGVDDPAFDGRFGTFRMAVLEHARNEEQEVFPLLRSSLDAEKLQSMRKAVELAERFAPTHPHPHGPESAVGNLVVGPFVSVVDRVRDALRGARSGKD